MDNDALIQCKRCKGDACYTQKVTPELSTYWCYSCGFISNDLMYEGQEYFNQQTSTLPDLYLDLLYKDEDNRYWMPSTVNIPDQGMVFAQGTSPLEWRWTAVKAVKRTDYKLCMHVPLPHTVPVNTCLLHIPTLQVNTYRHAQPVKPDPQSSGNSHLPTSTD